MPEIMKTNGSKAVCLEQLRKAFGDIVRLNEIANLIDAHILTNGKKIPMDEIADIESDIFKGII